MDKLKEAYRKFLNSKAGRSIEPNSILTPLVKSKIITKDEAEIIKNEPTRAKRQYQLFLVILPMKGRKVSKQTDMIIKTFRTFDSTELKNAYKDKNYGALFKLFLKQTKGLGKIEDVEKDMDKKLNLDDSFDSISSTDTSSTSGSTNAMTPISDLLDDDDDDTDCPFSVIVEDDDVPSNIPSISNSGYSSVRAQSDPGPNLLAVPEMSLSRRLSTEEKVQSADVDPSELELGPLIGSGGFAKVYNGRYKNQTVAVKMFRDYDDFTLSMFFEEVYIMMSLSHKNILQFLGFHNETAKHKLWLITEYVQGGSMRRFCKRRRDHVGDDVGLRLDQKLCIAASCWDGLDYLHKNNVCHKDISPDNILISDDLSVVKISDFGLAEFKQLMVTVVTQISGTPMYYPPEYASENGILRHPIKSDVYSMGASLCEFFSEQWFWNDGDSPKNHFQILFLLSEQRKTVESGMFPKDPSCWSRIPDRVKKILQQAIDPDYSKRKSAGDLCKMTNTLHDALVKEINDE